MAYIGYAVPVQTRSETVSGNMRMPRPETKRSGVFGKIPDRDRDRWVWSGPDRVPIGPGPNFPNTTSERTRARYSTMVHSNVHFSALR